MDEKAIAPLDAVAYYVKVIIPQILAAPGPGTVSTSITVLAGLAQYLSFADFTGNANCFLFGAFIPVAGQSYSLLTGDTPLTDKSFFGALFKGAENGAKCYMELAIRTPDGEMLAVPMQNW